MLYERLLSRSNLIKHSFENGMRKM